jgi:YidC/Oxa1 family membrane protein insertase
MDRSSLTRWIFIGLAAFLFFQYGLPVLSGDKGKEATKQPLGPPDDSAPPADGRPAEQLCKLNGPRFRSVLSSKGGVLKHVWMEGKKYLIEKDGTKQPIDLVTTWKASRMPLRTNLRVPGKAAQQVRFDDLDWTVSAQTKNSCTFSYSDEHTELRKVITATDRPFELSVVLSVTNKASSERTHRLAIEQTDWRTEEETSGSMGRVAEFFTTAEIHSDQETERFDGGDFTPSEFAEPDFTTEKWRRVPGKAEWAAVNNSYFSKALFHVKGPSKPAGEALIEQWWDVAKFTQRENDPNNGHVYRARLAYAPHTLATGASTSYELRVFVGPKERSVLAGFGGVGSTLDAPKLLDLGVFGAIGKLLIQYLYFLYGFTKAWGWAICLLTITVKLLLFPLSITQIKSTMGMRKLKPEMDELNKKYKDDAQQKGVAMQELWRKNNVTNPMLGCLPVLFQMPVWFALYTSLQTAVELYHEPFGPFIPDLSAPGEYFIIPALLGVSSFLQQQLMPMQGDAMQQKMMKWMMPAMFTVMMLFLPAGLGIYFLTNTWLGIIQQLGVEKYYQSQDKGDSSKQNGTDESDGDAKGSSGAFRKGKARV